MKVLKTDLENRSVRYAENPSYLVGQSADLGRVNDSYLVGQSADLGRVNHSYLVRQ